MVEGQRDKLQAFSWAKDGRAIPVEIVARPIDHAGTPALLLHVRDITERKRTEEQLVKLSRAVEQTADGVFITDRNGTIEYVNPAFEQMTGYAAAEALGQTLRLLRSERHDRDFYQRLWNTVLAGQVFRAVLTNRKKCGELLYADQTITPLKDAAGQVTHFVATVKDITESKAAEEELHKSRERFALAVLASKDGIWDWDMLTDEVYYSPRWKEMIGYADHEIRNHFSEWQSRLHPDDRDRALATIKDYVDGEIPDYELEHRLRHKNGTYRWILRGAWPSATPTASRTAWLARRRTSRSATRGGGTAAGQGGGRGCQPGEKRIRRQRQPRAAHAAQRHPWHEPVVASHAGDGRAARIPGDHAVVGRGAAGRHQ